MFNAGWTFGNHPGYSGTFLASWVDNDGEENVTELYYNLLCDKWFFTDTSDCDGEEVKTVIAYAEKPSPMSKDVNLCEHEQRYYGGVCHDTDDQFRFYYHWFYCTRCLTIAVNMIPFDTQELMTEIGETTFVKYNSTPKQT